LSPLSSIARLGSLPYIELAFLLAAIAGIIRIAMGMARLAVLLSFISHSVLLGFTSGAAALIVHKQLPGLLDIHIVQCPGGQGTAPRRPGLFRRSGFLLKDKGTAEFKAVYLKDQKRKWKCRKK